MGSRSSFACAARPGARLSDGRHRPSLSLLPAQGQVRAHGVTDLAARAAADGGWLPTFGGPCSVGVTACRTAELCQAFPDELAGARVASVAGLSLGPFRTADRVGHPPGAGAGVSEEHERIDIVPVLAHVLLEPSDRLLWPAASQEVQTEREPMLDRGPRRPGSGPCWGSGPGSAHGSARSACRRGERRRRRR